MKKDIKPENLNLEGFTKPVPKEIIFAYWSQYDDGTPISLIPELCGIGNKKLTAIRKAEQDGLIPTSWKQEYLEKSK